MKKPFLLTTAACIALCSAFAQQAGTLDATFGSGGKVFTYFNNKGGARTLLIQPDSNIVAIGSTNTSSAKIALARYRPDGSPDLSFGNAGTIEQTVKGFSELGTDGLLQPDGKIVVAGYAFNLGGNTNDDFVLIRYKTNGTPDSTFGVNGIAMNAITNGLDRIYGAALQTDGKIVVVGESMSTTAPYNYSLIVSRYKTNGTFDSTFGINGSIAAGLANTDIVGRDIAIQADGKIVVTAVYINSTKNFCVARLNTNGTPDASFGTNGMVYTLVALDAQSQSLAIQPDGKIVLGGTSNDAGRGYFTLVRYNSNGTLDNSFGTGGIVQSNVGNTSWGMTVKLQADGKVLLTGYGTTIIDQANKMCFLLARYHTNGSLDTTFGTQGSVFTQMGSNRAYSNAIAFQQDGKIVLGGSSNFFGGFALARYYGDSVGNGPVAIPLVHNDNRALLIPNPAHHTAILQYSLSTAAPVSINITDATGRLIKTLQAVQRAAGNHKENIELAGLPPGSYIITIQKGNTIECLRLVKQ